MTDTSLEDRILIRELYGRFALGVAQQDPKRWIDCWAAEGVWKTPHFETVGQAAISQQWDATWSAFSSVSAFNEVGPIAVTGDSAEATSSVYEVIVMAGGGTLKMAGLYEDSFTRENGEWKFSRRNYMLLSEEISAPA